MRLLELWNYRRLGGNECISLLGKSCAAGVGDGPKGGRSKGGAQLC